MKIIVIAFFLSILSACGTIGGAVSGAGTDLTKAGEWIRSK
jgi:hypothetical protein